MSATVIPVGPVDWHRGNMRVKLSLALDGTIRWRPATRSVKDWVVWASGKSNYLITKVLNQFWNATAYSFPGTIYAAGWTTTLTAASTGSSGTESAYTSYARVTITANTTNFPLSVAASNIQNATAITFPANTGSLSTWTYFAICDASTAGNMLYWGSITSTAVNPGDTPQVNINGLTASEA
jgi:hypothetical protein